MASEYCAPTGAVSLTASLAVGGACVAAVAALTGLARTLLLRHGVMDRPSERSSHQTAIPRGGGLVTTGVLLAAWLTLWLSGTSARSEAQFWIVIACALGLAAVSWLDDLRGGLSVSLRLAAQVLAVGVGIASLPGDGLILQGTVPALVDHALAAAAWLWFVNLFNFMDGIDGLSGVEGASLGLGAFLLALLGAAPAGLGPLGLAFAGVSLGFVLWNWHPAKIFLGDVGSIPLGYLAGWLMLALAAAGAWQAALLLPAYYLADATVTLVCRLLRGRRVWQAHREHFYQRVVAAGWSHGRTTAVIAGHNLLLMGLALASQQSWSAAAAALAAGALLVATLLWYLHAAARTSCGASNGRDMRRIRTGLIVKRVHLIAAHDVAKAGVLFALALLLRHGFGSIFRRDAGGKRDIDARPIGPEDLLGRPQVTPDRFAMRGLVDGRRVCITGAGGTIGAELARQIADGGPAHLTLLDSSEYNLYRIDLELEEAHPELPRSAVLGDLRDPGSIAATFSSARPELVFHAAALKHVHMVETNPNEGALTNAVGTRNVADACIVFGARLMVLVSTDKSVAPTSVMGATKHIAENYCQALAGAPAAGGLRLVTVRFGNVIGSSGSVVPRFQRQIAAGGPVTVTDPDAARYFMTAREAVQLLLQASALGASEESGGIYVLDMGKPIKIVDLARRMIRLAGLTPDRDIEIVYTGLRPGEKRDETLFNQGEPMLVTGTPGIFRARSRPADLALMRRRLDQLAAAAHDRRTADALALVATLVPEYEPSESALSTVSANASLAL